MNLYLIILLFFAALIPKSLSSQNSKYDACSKKIQCGSLGHNIGYPFYDGSTRPDYCGLSGLKLDNCDGDPEITISDQEYYLKGIDVDKYIITVYKKYNWDDKCPDSLANTTLDYSRFKFPSTDQNITFFYDCDTRYNSELAQNLSLIGDCNITGTQSPVYYLTQAMLEKYKDLNLPHICNSSLFLPVLQSQADYINGDPYNLGILTSALEAGFELGLIADNDACSSCVESNGECGRDLVSNKFVCHCANHDYGITCGVNSPSPDKGRKNKMPFIIGVSIGVVVLIALLGGCLVFTRSRIPPYILQKHKPIPKYQDVEDCLKNYASLVPKRYPYTYIEKITKSFREKLGEGGYGSVFKGNLQDGRAVAVKVWKQSKGDGQDFVNEVMSISRTSHVNVVPLLGFCFEGHKWALIYEYMPNGSLEKFLHGRDFDQNNQSLSAQKLFEIALGIARGLEYLHRGCNTRIVHFDIKPHNILLDAEFTPKISDFGLAKSLKQKESIISMSGARGTAGYIAPEVVLRSFGGVSHKADVYSFGMMVLEMVGCKKRGNDHNVENSSEMYFPQWIYKQLEQGTSTLYCKTILNEEEKELEKKMILVGLGCIQTNPLSRPTMSRVVEMLEGKVDLLEIPPMPTLASPPRQHQQPTNDDSTNVLSSTIYART